MRRPTDAPRADAALGGGGPRRVSESEWGLGLAWMARELGRDLQRPARAVGGPAELWSASPRMLGRALGVADAELARLLRGRTAFDAAAERATLARAGVVHRGRSEPGAPARLADLHDPPFGLFVRASDPAGALARLSDGPVIAMVGSRRATPAGLRLARELAGELTRRGGLVVSGLAHGIDAAAHEGALEAGEATVAVLGCGVDVPYPRRNVRLAARIAEAGALVAELWPGTPPAPWHFPARNRIVAGLADAVCVIEAGRRSGALITADFALELGRPVLAVPGWPGAVASEGANALLRAGAALLEEVGDVVAEVPDAAWRPALGGAAAAPDGLAGRIDEALRRRPMRADELVAHLGVGPGQVAAALSLLEVEGHALRGGAQRFWAAPRSCGAGRGAARGSGEELHQGGDADRHDHEAQDAR